MDIKKQDCYLPVDVNERLPEKGRIVPVLLNLKSKIYDILHRMHHTGKWFDYDKNITHWLEKKENMIVLTESEYLADKKKTAEGWINVDDHLPDKDEFVLVYFGHVNLCPELDFYDKKFKHWSKPFYPHKITHWQPLPKSPTT